MIMAFYRFESINLGASSNILVHFGDRGTYLVFYRFESINFGFQFKLSHYSKYLHGLVYLNLTTYDNVIL